ncbi:hypothetical protein ACLKA6_003254 [Drosophila palustris]
MFARKEKIMTDVLTGEVKQRGRGAVQGMRTSVPPTTRATQHNYSISGHHKRASSRRLFFSALDHQVTSRSPLNHALASVTQLTTACALHLGAFALSPRGASNNSWCPKSPFSNPCGNKDQVYNPYSSKDFPSYPSSNKDQVLNPCGNKDTLSYPSSNKDQVLNPCGNKDTLSYPSSNKDQVLNPCGNKDTHNDLRSNQDQVNSPCGNKDILSSPCGNKESQQFSRLCGSKDLASSPCGNKEPGINPCGNKDSTHQVLR